MATKITIFFNQAQRGWTETWYSQTSVQAFNPTAGAFNTFLLARFNLLAAPGAIYGVRISNVGVRVSAGLFYSASSSNKAWAILLPQQTHPT